MQRSQQNLSQIGSLVLQRHREETLFSELPQELIQEIMNYGQAVNEDAAKLLRHAAYARKEDVDAIIAMLDANPSLLFDTSDVMTPGGLDVRCATVYEFALGAGDPELAALIGKYFAKLGAEGEAEKARQYERYRPHIEALAKQIESKQPAFDLRPLIDIIKKSSPADITAALKKDMTHQSLLRDAMCAFRNAVRPTRQTGGGMHYKHYTTLMQAFDLLYDEWMNLKNGDNYDKCDLVWRQIIGYLMRGLPHIDRFAFARAFQDGERTLSYKYDPDNFFPDTTSDVVDFSGLGFDFAIFGWGLCAIAMGRARRGGREFWKLHVEQKLRTCRTYAATVTPSSSGRPCERTF